VARKRRHRSLSSSSAARVSVGGARADINVTPLVDVVLVLLIIFMVVTPMLHRGVKIELPQTAHHDKRQDTGEQLIVSVRADGVYIETDHVADVPEVGKQAAPVDEKQRDEVVARLKKELREGSRPAFVRADKHLKYGQVRYVLEQLHAAGVGAVSMQTEDH